MHTPEELDEMKIELAVKLKKMMNTKEFKEIILNGYLESGSVYLVKNFTKVKPEEQMSIVEQMKSRSNLWKYLDGIEEEARNAIESRNFIAV